MSTIARNLRSTTATILEGETTSSRVRNSEFAILALMVPPSFEGTELTFEVSVDGTTFVELQDEIGLAAAKIQNVVAQTAYPIPPGVELWPWFRVVSNVEAAADRSIVVVLKS